MEQRELEREWASSTTVRAAWRAIVVDLVAEQRAAAVGALDLKEVPPLEADSARRQVTPERHGVVADAAAE